MRAARWPPSLHWLTPPSGCTAEASVVLILHKRCGGAPPFLNVALRRSRGAGHVAGQSQQNAGSPTAPRPLMAGRASLLPEPGTLDGSKSPAACHQNTCHAHLHECLHLGTKPTAVPKPPQQLKPHKQRRQHKALHWQKEQDEQAGRCSAAIGKHTCDSCGCAVTLSAGRAARRMPLPHATASVLHPRQALQCHHAVPCTRPPPPPPTWKKESSRAGLRRSAIWCPNTIWATHERR